MSAKTIVKSVLLGALLSVLSLFISSDQLLDGCAWDPSLPSCTSWLATVKTWGTPVSYIIDHPYQPTVGRVNWGDHFSLGAALKNWALWAAFSLVSYWIVLRFTPRRWGFRQQETART